MAKTPNPFAGRPPKISLSPAKFVKDYRRAGRMLERSLDLVLENCGEAEVHEVRTAARKMSAHLKLLPEKLREKGKVKKFEGDLDDVMEATADIRDIDVITQKLMREGDSADRIVRHGEKKRRELLDGARRAVKTARKRKLPKIDEKDLSPSGLRARFNRVAGRLEGDIEELIPVVARDSADLTSLHQLRIDSKKLRNLYECLSAKDSALRKVEGLQDKLGSIHDWDISVEFAIKSEPDSKIIERWEASRKKEYEELVSTLSKGRLPEPEEP